MTAAVADEGVLVTVRAQILTGAELSKVDAFYRKLYGSCSFQMVQATQRESLRVFDQSLCNRVRNGSDAAIAEPYRIGPADTGEVLHKHRFFIRIQ